MGIFETASEGTQIGRPAAAGLSKQGQLPARVRPWTHCRGLSGSSLVSLLHAGSPGANHPTTSDRRQDRGRPCLRSKPANFPNFPRKLTINPASRQNPSDIARAVASTTESVHALSAFCFLLSAF